MLGLLLNGVEYLASAGSVALKFRVGHFEALTA
jgi:hypothetical protein